MLLNHFLWYSILGSGGVDHYRRDSSAWGGQGTGAGGSNHSNLPFIKNLASKYFDGDYPCVCM